MNPLRDGSRARTGIPFVLSAPSGAGKTTVCRHLRGILPELRFSVSHTTRPPRPGEQDGEDYFFVSSEAFEKKIAAGELIEWARVFDNYYGTARATVDAATEDGADLLIEIDVQGAKTLRGMDFPAVFVFLLPPSLGELASRLRQRGTDSEDKIKQRLAASREEIRALALYDYVVVNVEPARAAAELAAIMQAEHRRTSRFTAPSGDIRALLDFRTQQP